MNNEEYWIPRTLDDPPLFLFFQMDSAMLFLTLFLLTISFNILLAVIVAVGVTRLYVQLKENGDKGLVTQLCYWYTPSGMWLSPFWTSSVREYAGR